MAKQYIAEVGAVFALRALGSGLNLLGVLLIARGLSDNDFGIYGSIACALTACGVICRYGTSTTVVRFSREYVADCAFGKARGVLCAFEQRVVAIVSKLTVSGVALGLLAWLLRNEPLEYTAGFLILPSFVLSDYFSSVTRSYGGILAGIAPKDVLWRFSIVVIAMLSLFLKVEGRLSAILMFSATSLSVIAALQRRILKNYIPTTVADATPEYDETRWWKACRPVWFVEVARVSFETADVIVVGAMLSYSEAGQYFLASRIAQLIAFALSSVNLAAGPNIARLYSEDRETELRRYLAITNLSVVVLSLVACSTLALFAPKLLELFGQSHIDVFPVLLVLSVGQIANAAFGSSGVLLNMTGNESTTAVVMVGSSLVTLMLVVGLAGVWGVLGAAIGSSLGMVLWNFGLWQATRRCTVFDSSLVGTALFFCGDTQD